MARIAETPVQNLLGIPLSCAQSMIVARNALLMAKHAAISEAQGEQPVFARHWTRVAERIESALAELDKADVLRRAPADRSGEVTGEVFRARVA